ncbi:MAG: IreB family regulatory phosphoprotein [Clostridia bacterium]|nr:IreB family regulatory phosphoprotein [Clostridia bacterium]MBR3295957.1 IreB family regulatory phosphoprotein [Clostridia bacterium]
MSKGADMKKIGETTRFTRTKDIDNPVRGILRLVCEAMMEKGYNPVDQIVGYLASGDPTYVTSYNSARNLLTRLDRDEILEEIVESYIESIVNEEE